MDIHDMDQTFAAIVDITKIQRKYYDEAMKNGHTREEALYLSAMFMQSLVGGQDK